MDSTYFANLDKATFDANNRINASNLSSANARTNLENTLAQLGYQQGLQTTNVQNAENSRGGFALGHLGQTIGQLNRTYLDRQSADQNAYSQQEAGRSAARAAITGGLSLTQAALAAAAADRASAKAAADKTAGLGSGPGVAPPAAPAATPTLPATWSAAPQRDVKLPASWRGTAVGDKRVTKSPARPTGGAGLWK